MRLQTTRIGPFIIYHMKKFRRDEYQFDVMQGNEIVFIGKTIEEATAYCKRRLTPSLTGEEGE